MKLVLATFNRDKASELGVLLAAANVEIVPLSDWPAAVAPEESGATLLENARIKALAALRTTGLPSIADDTGLEVDALNGAPGVLAARYAGPGASYSDNVAKLLRDLAGVPHIRRTARFRTVCAAVWPDGREIVTQGTLAGHILEQARGLGGFGYDPVFLLPDGQTLAELSVAEKNSRSHRAQAVAVMAVRLATV